MSPRDPAALLAAARAAAEIRAHQTDPDVVALDVTRASMWIERVIWTAVLIGLGFTAASVHAWYTAGAGTLSALWWVGWMVTPTVEIIAVAVLRGEQILGRHGITPGRRTVTARRGLLAFALTLQLWGPLTTLGDPGPGIHGTVGNVAVHAFVILAVILGAEAITELRESLNAAIRAAAERVTDHRTDRRTDRRANRHRHRRTAPPPPVDPPSADPSPSADPPVDPPLTDSPPPPDDDAPGKGEIALTWIAEHWPADQPDPPTPAEIQAGLLARGVSISRGYACKVRAAATTDRAADREEQTG